MGLKLEEVVGKVLTEKQFDEAAGEKDACYNKVKARYDVWPSAYASGALVKCRKVGAKNWGNKSKKEGVNEGNPLELGKLKDAIKMFQKRIKKQGRVTNARDEEHLKRLMKVYNDMGGRKIKENNELFEWLHEACWKGYEKKGMKKMFGKMYPNCVKKTKKKEGVDEASSAAQQAAIAIAKKKSGKYDKDGKKIKEYRVEKGRKVSMDGEDLGPVEESTNVWLGENEIYWENNLGESCGYTFELDKDDDINEAEYQGRKVKLGKPMQGDAKKFKVYVKNDKGNVVKVNFGQGGKAKGGTMKIRKSNPKARKSFRARHNCDNPGPRHKARYWSCKKW